MKDPNASLKASSINKYAKYKRRHTQIRSLRKTKEHKVNRLTEIRYSKTLSKTDITKIKQEVTTRKDKISVPAQKPDVTQPQTQSSSALCSFLQSNSN